MVSISLCMIVKNEERFLPMCLESVKGLVNEIVIVDTGSTDSTREIARKFSARLIYYKWDGNTAHARNLGVREATGDWILALDADEVLTEKEHESIRKLTQMDYDAYYLVQLNYTNEVNHLLFRPVTEKTKQSGDFRGYYPVEIIRFFRNRKGIEFRSIVHERLNESVKELGLKAARTDIPIHHYQHLKGPEELKRKQLAFLDLFERKVKEYPNDAKMHFDMGVIYYNFKNDEANAIRCFENAISIDPNYVDPLFSLATIYMRKNDNAKAEEIYKKILGMNSRNAAVHYNLGNVYLKQKKFMDAAKSYGEAIKLNPNMMQAYNNLGNILIMGRKYKEAASAYKIAIKLNHPRKEELMKKVEQLEKLAGQEISRNL